MANVCTISGDDDDGDDVENANKRLSKESEGRKDLMHKKDRISIEILFVIYSIDIAVLCNLKYLYSLCLIYI